MKKYKILKGEFFLAPNGDLMMSNDIIDSNELLLDELGVFMTMAYMYCKGEELTDINVTNKGPQPLEEMYPIFQGLIDKKYIEEI